MLRLEIDDNTIRIISIFLDTEAQNVPTEFLIDTSDKEVGYQQKTENQAKNDKTEHVMEKTVQNQAKVPKNQSQIQYRRNHHVKNREPELKNTIGCKSNPTDGRKYALEILKKCGLDFSASVDTLVVEKMKLDEDRQGKLVDPTCFRGMVGSLMYLSASRRDIVFVVCMCAQYQAKPAEKHLHAIKRIFRYLKGTIHMGLWYLKDSGFAPRAFAYADYAGCQDTRRSTSGSAQFLEDKLHIDIRHHFIKEQVENRVVEVYFVETKYQLADIFTKALPRERFELILPLLGMKQLSPETLKELQESANE
ncbi:hypothetical protein Tco_0320992 [Tanacetum coccineum]